MALSDEPGLLAEPAGTGDVGRRCCEHRHINEPETCGAPASYNVSRGRKYDAQDSCRRHLAATVDALREGQDVAITVRAVRDDRSARYERGSRVAAKLLGPVLDEVDIPEPARPSPVPGTGEERDM
jgi:hypothetical protein